MGFLNVYNNFRNFNAHISHAFKVTFFDNAPENGNILLSTCVKSITKPVFKLDTEKHNYNFGNSRFVIPIIDFSSARMSVTFYEEDNMAVQAALTGYLGNLGGFVPEVNILLEEFTNDMLYIISSKVYRARLIELSLPGFNNEGEGSIQEITAEFNVTRIYDSMKEFETSIHNYNTKQKYEYTTNTKTSHYKNYVDLKNIGAIAKSPLKVELSTYNKTQEIFMDYLAERTELTASLEDLESRVRTPEDVARLTEQLSAVNEKLNSLGEGSEKYKKLKNIISSLTMYQGDYYIMPNGTTTDIYGNATNTGLLKFNGLVEMAQYINDELESASTGGIGVEHDENGYVTKGKSGLKSAGITVADLDHILEANMENIMATNIDDEREVIQQKIDAINNKLSEMRNTNEIKELFDDEKSKDAVLNAANGIDIPEPKTIITGASAAAGGVPPDTPPELIHTGYHYVKSDGTMGSEIKFDPPAGGNLHVRDGSIKETVIGTSTAVKHSKMKGEAKTNHEKAVIEKFSPIVLKIAKEKNIDEAMLPGMFAQMMQESGWLTSYDSTKEVNNFFGLTGAASGTKSYVVSRTHEVAYELKDKEKPADRQVAVIRAFSQYDNAEDAIRDWMDRTVLSKRYQFGKDGKSGGFQTGGWNKNDVHSYIKVMKNNGYATATNYINEVNDIIDKHPSIKNLKYK